MGMHPGGGNRRVIFGEGGRFDLAYFITMVEE
jgi:hypothetical protein